MWFLHDMSCMILTVLISFCPGYGKRARPAWGDDGGEEENQNLASAFKTAKEELVRVRRLGTVVRSLENTHTNGLAYR